MKPDWDAAIEEAAKLCEDRPNVPGKYLANSIRRLLLVGSVGINARLARIERFMEHITGVELKEEQTAMATNETLQRLNANLKANTDATAAVKDALQHYAQSSADLTAQLQAAIANNDEAAISEAANQLAQNNADLLANVPAAAAAVVEGTPAAPPAPPAPETPAAGDVQL